VLNAAQLGEGADKTMEERPMRLLIVLAILAALTVTGADAKRGGHKPQSVALVAAPECSAPDVPRWTWTQITGSGFVPKFWTDPLDPESPVFTDTLYTVVVTNERGDITLTGTDVQTDGSIALDYFVVWGGTNTVTIWKPVDGVDVTAICTFVAS